MGHQLVRSVMTTGTASVGPDAEFKEIVRILQTRKVSAVPVVDANGRVLGVVSEADLLRKEAYAGGEDGAPEATRGLFGAHRARAKARAVRACELMSAPPVTIRADRSVVDAARLMERRGVKRLPVVDADGRLEGIVSRCDLIRVFLRDDEQIRAEITEDVLTRALWINPAAVAVTVDGGRVHLAGLLEFKSLIPLVVRLCRAVDGVVDVTHALRFDHDDTHRLPSRRRPIGIADQRIARL
ncbi:CBS domain-containing protein [Yinghuangia soli]|uniref:CBS domain-containing protein n=1 Tax=Yinghuangia soli TaxID=2908204 RepID=A0AA41U0S8_9ACTN|nr:CBS domain-containing protein [Yinghuangia soli]MCF2528916.1 CBS domain-containing protein [Yinghuangia soli]